MAMSVSLPHNILDGKLCVCVCVLSVGLFRPVMGQLLHNTSHQYCAGDEIEKNEIGAACSAGGGGWEQKRR